MTSEVTQADYDAAQAFFRDQRVGLAVKFQLGAEPQPLLEAFAAHRLAHRGGEVVAAQIVREVAELPDRTSPDDWPEAMLVTADELERHPVDNRPPTPNPLVDRGVGFW